MAHVRTPYVVMAYIVMADVVMAYVVMAYIVIAFVVVLLSLDTCDVCIDMCSCCCISRRTMPKNLVPRPSVQACREAIS